MKILATNSEVVLRSLMGAGLTAKQVGRLLNRTLLCLDYIGRGKRVGVEVFNHFSGEVRAKGRRMRFHQLLIEAGLIEQDRPHVQSLCSAGYKLTGEPIEQAIQLNRKEAQIKRKIEAEHRRKGLDDQTLQWLCRGVKHSFEGEAYSNLARMPQWPFVSFQRAFAGIVAAVRRREFLGRYFRKQLEGRSMELNSEGAIEDKGLSADYFEVVEVYKFADNLHGKPCTIEELEDLQHGRVLHVVKKEGFEYLMRRFEKCLVEEVVELLKQRNIFCATDRFNLYAEDSEALEQSFIQAVNHVLQVDVTLRDKPILTPLYIDRLRKLKAKKEGIELSKVPRVRAKYWQPKTEKAEGGRIVFQRKPFDPSDILLETVEQAKAFYGVDLEAKEAQAVTLSEARRQIDQFGSVKASNEKGAIAALYEMGHALPTEPTGQLWELTAKGQQYLNMGKKGEKKLVHREQSKVLNLPLGQCQSQLDP